MPEDNGGRKTPRINVRRSLSDAIRDAERLQGVAERLLDELYAIEHAVNGDQQVPAAKPAAPTGPAPVAQNFHLEAAGNGRATFSFGEGKGVALPPALVAMISILVSAKEESSDELVAWKSLDRIGQLMAEQIHRRYNRHAVLQLLTRLRAVFSVAGFDPRLVESAPGKGARLRLKRRVCGVCAS
jgi:hypothetical protein